MRNMIFVLLMLGAVLNLSGQEPVSQPDDTPGGFDQYQKALGVGYFNLYLLSGYQAAGPFDLTMKFSRPSGAWRFGTGISVSGSNQVDGDLRIKQNSIYLSPRAGYEFYYLFGRFRLHYGADVFGFFDHSVSERFNNDPNYEHRDTERRFGMGIGPVLGLSIFLHPRVSVSTETTLQIFVDRSRMETLRNGSSDTYTMESWGSVLAPLGQLSLYFHF